jgi:large subunit ribosomal protein L21
MYAIIKAGGKQYRVSPGDIIDVERVDAEVGGSIDLGSVLCISDENNTSIGTPTVPNAKVTAEVVGQGRFKKIRVFKKKRRKTYQRSKGHRQSFTKVKITEITAGN